MNEGAAAYPKAREIPRLLGGLVRIPVGRGDEADVDDCVRRRAPQPAHHPILDHPQELRLQHVRHLGDLVQEERAPVRHLQETRLLPDRSGERALYVAEHLALEQRLRQRRTVHCHHLPAAAPAVMVDELGDLLLAGPALSREEHRRIRGRHLARQRDDALERGRGAQQRHLVAVSVLLLERGLQVLRFARHQHRVGRPPQQNLQVTRGERLGQVIPGTRPQRLDARSDARVPRHDDRDRVRIRVQARLEQLHSRYLRHVQIEQHDVERAALHHRQRLVALAARGHRVPLQRQHARAALAQGVLVIHHQDADRALDLFGQGQGLCWIHGRTSSPGQVACSAVRGARRLSEPSRANDPFVASAPDCNGRTVPCGAGLTPISRCQTRVKARPRCRPWIPVSSFSLS